MGIGVRGEGFPWWSLWRRHVVRIRRLHYYLPPPREQKPREREKQTASDRISKKERERNQTQTIAKNYKGVQNRKVENEVGLEK